MIALITAILPVIFKIIEMIINKSNEKVKLREDFISFIENLEKDAPKSPKLRKSYNAQIERLKKKIKESEK